MINADTKMINADTKNRPYKYSNCDMTPES